VFAPQLEAANGQLDAARAQQAEADSLYSQLQTAQVNRVTQRPAQTCSITTVECWLRKMSINVHMHLAQQAELATTAAATARLEDQLRHAEEELEAAHGEWLVLDGMKQYR
jgi:hypothetical protein